MFPPQQPYERQAEQFQHRRPALAETVPPLRVQMRTGSFGLYPAMFSLQGPVLPTVHSGSTPVAGSG